jgi:hypothetical protein
MEKKKLEAMLNYLEEKAKEKDWHAVSDAANDLRVLEARENPEKDLPWFVEAGIELSTEIINGQKYRTARLRKSATAGKV